MELTVKGYLPGAGFASSVGISTLVLVVMVLYTYRTVDGYAVTSTQCVSNMTVSDNSTRHAKRTAISTSGLILYRVFHDFRA